MKLNDVKIGKVCFIESFNTPSSIKKRLLDVGFVKGVMIKPLIRNKSMTIYKIKGTVVGVRNDDAENIEVSL